MFLAENFNSLGNGNIKLNSSSNSLEESYEYWKEVLFERCMRLFEWDCGNIPQKEIEQRLLLLGFCIITKNNDNQLVCASGSLSDCDLYFDEYKNATYSMPRESGVRVINENCVIINNTSIRNSLFHMIHKYSLMLAHTDISIVCELVNIRKTKTFSARNNAVMKRINEWMDRIYNGKLTTILDDYTDGVNCFETVHSSTNLLNLLECRTQLLKSFYTDIGVKCSYDKKERMNVEEVAMDDNLLLININDMLQMRKEGCNAVNKIFGENWNVKESINRNVSMAKQEENESIEDIENES